MKFLWIQIEDNYPNYQKFKIKEIINTMLDNNYINVNVSDAYLNNHKVLYILKDIELIAEYKKLMKLPNENKE